MAKRIIGINDKLTNQLEIRNFIRAIGELPCQCFIELKRDKVGLDTAWIDGNYSNQCEKTIMAEYSSRAWQSGYYDCVIINACHQANKISIPIGWIHTLWILSSCRIEIDTEENNGKKV